MANKHLDHLEDMPVLYGQKGVSATFDYCESVIDKLQGNPSKNLGISVKYDGAPALVCGINPENGNFFVGTKSVFNKIPLINYSVEDIRRNHAGVLASKLEVALKYLEPVFKGSHLILQGDLLFTKEDVKQRKIGDELCYVFRPNTIAYAAPIKSQLGKIIKQAHMGIVFHTGYVGKQMSDLKTVFIPDMSRLHHSKDVYMASAEFTSVAGVASFDASESQKMKMLLSQAKSTSHRMSSGFLKDISTTEIQEYALQFANAMVRKNVRHDQPAQRFKAFVEFIEQYLQAKADKLKTERAKSIAVQRKKQLIDLATKNRANWESLFAFQNKIQDIKQIILKKLQDSKQELRSYLEADDGGYKATAPEGFVAINKVGNAVKFVDRFEFSQANFLAAKDWKPATAKIVLPNNKKYEPKMVVLAFGRLNPPSTGHLKLVKTIMNTAKVEKGTPALFMSKSHDPKKNPLTYAQKLHYAQLAFPKIHVIDSSAVNNPFQTIAWAKDNGYTDMIFVCGSDRVSEYNRIFSTYNKGQLNTIKVLSAGERDPDSDDVSGMSASKLRKYVEAGNLTMFLSGVPLHKADGVKMFNDLKRGMGIKNAK